VINHSWHNQNAVIAGRIAQQIIEGVKLLKFSRNLDITRINQNNKNEEKIVRVIPINKP
jgi:hypothetical protein